MERKVLKSQPSRRAGPVDKHVGTRILERQILLGLTQQQLAFQIGMTFQQVSKYQRGLTRIAVSRLYEVARVLGVPISYFFEGLEEGAPVVVSLEQREQLDLAQNFAKITDGRRKAALAKLARVMTEP